MENGTTTKPTCFNVYHTRFEISDEQRTILIVYTLTVNGVLNFILNTFVLLLLKISGQLKTNSMRLIAYISCSDLCISITTPAIITLMLTKYKQNTNCTVELIGQAVNIFLGHLTAFIVALISFDRYARMKYLNEYTIKMTTKRSNLLAAFVIFMAMVNTLLYTFGSLFEFYESAWFIVLIIDTIAVLMMASFYIMATRIVKIHRRKAQNTETLKSVDKTMTALTKKFLLSVVLFYGIYLGLNFTNMVAHDSATKEQKRWIEFFHYAGLLIGVTNSVANAAIFINVNKRARRRFKEFIYGNKTGEVELTSSSLVVAKQ